MTQTPNRTFADYAQIPLAIGSFVFFRLMRLALRGFVALVNRARRGKASSWRVVSADLIGKPLALPIFMTKAPRWNTHAIMAMAGPLIVKSSITIHTGQANESAEIWGLTVQPLGQGREQRVSSAGEINVEEKTLQLPAGDYMLVMRYYGPRKQVNLPAIRIDEQDQVAAKEVDPDNNRFYASLSQRSSWLYVWLSFYVYTMLRFADMLPKSFITKEYLPAGDPGMGYKFGAVRRGAALQVQVPQAVLSDYTVYFTRYNRASFPVASQEIGTPDCTISGAEQDGYYLIRLLSHQGNADLNAAELLTVTNVAEPASGKSPA